MKKRLDVARLIEDCGGPSHVAKLCKVVRTAPYGWAKRNFINSKMIEALVSAHPRLNLNRYFIEDTTNGHDEPRTRIPRPRLVSDTREQRDKATPHPVERISDKTSDQ